MKDLVSHYNHSWNFVQFLTTLRTMPFDRVPVMYFFILSSSPRTFRQISLVCKVVSGNGDDLFALGTAEVVILS